MVRQAVIMAIALFLIVSSVAAGGEPRVDIRQLEAATETLRPLHKKPGKPRRGDWLYHHHEPGQTFRQYLACGPVLPRGRRRTIYIQPIGDFSEAQRRIIDLTADFMQRCFDRPVKVRGNLPLSTIPQEARRVHPTWGVKQILTTYVLDDVLAPRLPKDAAALIAFTTSDLWPGPGWNFVFGQASLRKRVGVWSLHRNGDPDPGKDAFRLCLLRTLKTATHETGHMFSMLHCTAFECNMCGSNHREESDARPLWLCPECMAKLCWATGTDPAERYRRLAEFAGKHGLESKYEFYERSRKSLSAVNRK